MKNRTDRVARLSGVRKSAYNLAVESEVESCFCFSPSSPQTTRTDIVLFSAVHWLSSSTSEIDCEFLLSSFFLSAHSLYRVLHRILASDTKSYRFPFLLCNRHHRPRCKCPRRVADITFRHLHRQGSKSAVRSHHIMVSPQMHITVPGIHP